MTVTRFAPSPNGRLHLGHAYSAIVAHDRALRDGGHFLLRIEDIDGARSRPELAGDFRRDLDWLGLAYAEVTPQSRRIASYRSAADTLREMELLYPCTCTRAEIAAASSMHGPDGPLYPGTCRQRGTVAEREAAWRLDMRRAAALAGPLEWHDERHGVQQARPEMFGDVVLWRKDAPASYHLAATLDDAADGVTHVTRGVDLFRSTHIHRLLQHLLGLPVPIWHHHPVLVEGNGRKLAKRRDAPSLSDRRAGGEDGGALAARLRALAAGNDHLGTGISLSDAIDQEA